ncbi:sushi domain-containing protein 4 isoform X6 [Hypanus sabinus]|uniref:sushi domain-containing protein 4 isoform X6 n=1 Tax=Hypanus sabinus TaxID=79690 RepID=UPI0028C4B8B8|nr:sushi domain-containing protein 4 isoform X6 [Hypanus sabinus]
MTRAAHELACQSKRKSQFAPPTPSPTTQSQAGCCCREMYYGAIYSSLLSAGTHQHLPVAALMLCADVLLCVCTADQMFGTTCPLPFIEDADVYNSTYRPGDRLIISCHQGFQIRYPDMDIMVAVCPNDGMWDNLPSCQGCLRPRVFPHSYINVSDSLTTFPVGSVLRYQCFPGYKLSGSELLECTYNLLWSAGPPSCLDVEACPLPPIPAHGDYLCHPYPCDRYIHGTVLEFYCDPGYSLTTDYKYVTCQHGDWFPASQVFCQTIGQSWADREDTILSTWKVVAFTAISVLLALLLLVFIKAFQIRLKSPCQSNLCFSGEVERSGSRSFVVVEGVPVVLPTYEEAVCRCTIEQPDTQATALVAQGEQVPQASDQNPPAYPGRVSDPLLAANPVAPSRPGHLECAGTEEWEGSSPSMSFDTAATHPMTEEMVNSPSTEETASMCPSISILDGAA